MIITFAGRKSGKQYSTPASYFKENGNVYCFTHGGWWRNLKGGATVKLRIHGSDYQGHAEAIIENNDKKSDVLTKLLKSNPGDARIYNVSLDASGNPDKDAIDRAVVDAAMIETVLEATKTAVFQ
jgi:hypothetical protein